MTNILIIEDDREIAALQRDYLQMAGFEVTIRGDGISGLEAAKSGTYDLLVLDIMLPGLDGFDVLKKLRETSDVPVILLSAKSEDIDKIRGLGLGADDYMNKPFSPGELVARIRAHLSRFERLTGIGANKPRPKLTVRGLEVDREDRRVTLRGKECVLTPKEFDILLFLMENPNRVYSKEDLFERVWGLEAFGDSDTVVVHVRRLREKIEPDAQNPQYVETVWGAGYRLRV
ncbi:MAG: response regulator transcription factor [Oscillospiraceae bacterium]|nr:response regulator transcription factor [Oscillospiraceae bacterium]